MVRDNEFSPEIDCSVYPDVLNDNTFPDVIEITTATTMTIDPMTYINAITNECSGIRITPVITGVEERNSLLNGN